LALGLEKQRVLGGDTGFGTYILYLVVGNLDYTFYYLDGPLIAESMDHLSNGHQEHIPNWDLILGADEYLICGGRSRGTLYENFTSFKNR
jgi:hypothetical protein